MKNSKANEKKKNNGGEEEVLDPKKEIISMNMQSV